MRMPYPGKWVRPCALLDAARMTFRPIRPEDRRIESEFVRDISEESKYFRFMNEMRDLNRVILRRFT